MTIATYLDDDTWDIPQRPRYATGLERVGQKVKMRILTLIGEWFYDQEAGLPYQTDFQAKPVDPVAIGNTIRAEIEAVDEVIRVIPETWTSVFDVATRAVTCGGQIETTEGEITLQAYPLGAQSLTGNSLPYVILLLTPMGG